MLYGLSAGIAVCAGVREYGENVGVSSLRMCGGAAGGGGPRPDIDGGGLDDMSPPRATSSTLLGAGGAGAGSSLSNQDRFDFLGGSGCRGGGAPADGVGEGRDGDAP